MNREQYIKYRQLNLLGEVAYNYFIENGGAVVPQELFKQVLVKFAPTRPDINWDRLWDYYDVKFELTFLVDKENKIIKIF